MLRRRHQPLPVPLQHCHFPEPQDVQLLPKTTHISFKTQTLETKGKKMNPKQKQIGETQAKSKAPGCDCHCLWGQRPSSERLSAFWWKIDGKKRRFRRPWLRGKKKKTGIGELEDWWTLHIYIRWWWWRLLEGWREEYLEIGWWFDEVLSPTRIAEVFLPLFERFSA